MGRKSKAKKIIREVLKEKDQIEKNGLLKKLIGKKPKKNSSDDQQGAFDKRTIFGIGITILMVGFLVIFGYLIFQKAFRAKPIAKILPADSVVALAELNTNFDHNQLRKTFNLLSKKENYTQQKIISRIENTLKINFDSEVKNWLGRQAGIALIDNPENALVEVYFLEFTNRQNLENFLQKYQPQKTSHNNSLIYKGNNSLFFTMLDSYLLISRDLETLKFLLDQNTSSTPKLYNSSSYRRIDNNLPLSRTAFFYIDFSKITDAFFKKYPLLSEKGLSKDILNPFLKLLQAQGMVLVAMDEHFAIQSFLSLDEKVSENAQYLGFQEKYSAKLSNYLKNDLLLFWGGQNFENQLSRFLEILSSGNKSTLLIFDNLLQNYTEKYFGRDINFKEDILPLFDQEFAFAIEDFDNKVSYKILIELNSPQSDGLNIQQLANNFATEGAVFAPKIVEHTLPDGTISKEIIAIPEEIEKLESKYQSFTIFELKIGKQNWSVYYTILDDLAVIGSSIEAVKNTIDLYQNNSTSLRNSELFTSQIEPLIKSSDEVSYFNLQKINKLILKETTIPEPFSLINSVTSGRNYFQDGIVTINFLSLK